MANQVKATIVNNNGGSYPLSFSTLDIWIQESIGNATVNTNIFSYLGSPTQLKTNYKSSDTISDLLALAGNSMIQVTVRQIDSAGPVNFQALFPSTCDLIGFSEGNPVINAYLNYKGVNYFVTETQDDLIAAANAGGGGGGGSVESVTGDLVNNADPDNPIVNLAGTLGANRVINGNAKTLTFQNGTEFNVLGVSGSTAKFQLGDQALTNAVALVSIDAVGQINLLGQTTSTRFSQLQLGSDEAILSSTGNGGNAQLTLNADGTYKVDNLPATATLTNKVVMTYDTVTGVWEQIDPSAVLTGDVVVGGSTFHVKGGLITDIT